MTARVLVDVEELVIAYLLTKTPITDLVADRIGTELDLTAASPLPAVRVRRVATATVVRRHLEALNLQFECYAAGDLAAYDLARLVEAHVDDDGAGGLIGTHAGGVVTAAETSLGLIPLPDPATGAPRWLFGRNIYAHPAPPE